MTKKKEKITFTINNEFYDYTKEDLEELAHKYDMDYDKFLTQLFEIGIKVTEAIGHPYCGELVEKLCKNWVKDRT